MPAAPAFLLTFSAAVFAASFDENDSPAVATLRPLLAIKCQYQLPVEVFSTLNVT